MGRIDEIEPCCGEYRPWSEAAGVPKPFAEACGDCGWPRQDHIDMVNKALAAARQPSAPEHE